MSWDYEAELWEYKGVGAWHFITVPFEISTEIKLATMGPKRGFGSVRVQAQINGETFKTSVFPDKASGCYFLPVKASVRKTLGLAAGQMISVTLGLI